MNLRDKMIDVLESDLPMRDKLKALNDLVRRVRLPREKKGVLSRVRDYVRRRNGKKDK